jgi:hypothetical protein
MKLTIDGASSLLGSERGSESMRKMLIISAATVAALAMPAAALAQGAPPGTGVPVPGNSGIQPPAGVVSPDPATNTPHLKATQDNPVEQIRQLVQCGGTMYAVGSFSDILKGSTTYPRENIFSFDATAPYTVTSWAPDVVGVEGTTSNASDAINSIAFVGGNCADAYIGGDFSSINGTTVKNIAEISTTTGDVVSAFGHSAGGAVQTLLGLSGHLLAGGDFTSINGSSADPYFASLNPTTGSDDGFVHLNISGNYQYPCSGAGCDGSSASPNSTKVYNQALSHGGTLDLVMGDFTSVGGLPRQQIFMLNVGGSSATVTGWTSPQWDGSQGEATPSDPTSGWPYQCAGVEPFYIQAAAWSPNDGEVYIGTTGYHPNNWPIGETPRNGLCDAAAAFPSTQTTVYDTWINETGCDSLYAAAADANAAYFAGHERFTDNPNDCDALGPGGYNAPGLEGLAAASGDPFLDTAGTAGYYSRARGLGADDELVTSAGLWVASDNFDGSQTCGPDTNLAGICFLPYAN